MELSEGRAQAALEPLRKAFHVWQQLGAPYLAARVRLLVGRACLRRTLNTAKLELGATRVSVPRNLGAAAAGQRPAGQPAAAAPAGLTAREIQVLRLVATGKTNKLIAKELFLSEKTVDRHVSNIFVKIDVASRAAATAYAYERHLV